MDVRIEPRFEDFLDRVVKDGRFASASEAVSEGLRLVEEREAKLKVLRATLDAAIAQGGEVTDEELDADMAATSAQLRDRGYGA